MRIILPLSLIACATTGTHNYQEEQECPSLMTREQFDSGTVRCIAMCSSYGRNFVQYTLNCECVCEGKHNKQKGGNET